MCAKLSRAQNVAEKMEKFDSTSQSRGRKRSYLQESGDPERRTRLKEKTAKQKLKPRGLC